MKIREILLAFLFFCFGGYLIYSGLNYQEYHINNSSVFESEVLEVIHYDHKIEIIFKDLPEIIFETTSITEQALDLLIPNQELKNNTYKVYYIPYSSSESKPNFRKNRRHIVALFSLNKSILSFEEFNELERVKRKNGFYFGIVSLIASIITFTFFKKKQNLIALRKHEVKQGLCKIPSYKNGWLTLGGHKLKVKHKLKLDASKFGNYDFIELWLPISENTNTALLNAIKNQYSTKIKKGINYVVFKHPLTFKFKRKKLLKRTHKRLIEYDNFIEKRKSEYL